MRQHQHKYDVAAYIWPAYTGDAPRTLMFWPEGMGEWENVRNAVKKHPEHTWDIRLSDKSDNIIWKGAVDRKEFEVIALRNIQKYFFHPSYYCIEGKPVFMIYDLNQLIAGLGSLEQTADALTWWNEQAVDAGLKGIHFLIFHMLR